MTFTEYASRSVNDLRILVDIDITQSNTQWVNCGAGVWYVNMEGLYPEVDSSFLSGFSSIDISHVGSVLVDNLFLTESITLLECSENENTFFWDDSALELFIHCNEHDSPYLHSVSLGVVYGVSMQGFTPVGSNTFYESRLLSIPKITESRDPLYYGKLQYEGGSVSINNADGYFDLFGENNYLFGNKCRIYVGYEDLDIDNYENVFTGIIDTSNISSERLDINLIDKRKTLSKEITYTCTSLNCLSAIEEILLDNYDIPYNSVYYDTINWAIAKALVPNITISMQESAPAIDIIQGICFSCFGLFLIEPDERFSFKVVRSSNSVVDEVLKEDIKNYPELQYEPSEVISSTNIGYAKDWTTTGTAYTYLTDTSQESDIYAKYKLYNQRDFDTYLIDLSSAQDFSDTVLDYSGTVRATTSIEVPIKYWSINVGDFVIVTIDRVASTWLGSRKCEVIGKQYNLDSSSITFTVRIWGDELSYRVTIDGSYRITTDGYLRRIAL